MEKVEKLKPIDLEVLGALYKSLYFLANTAIL